MSFLMNIENTNIANKTDMSNGHWADFGRFYTLPYWPNSSTGKVQKYLNSVENF